MFPAFSQTYQELSERAVAATEQDSLSRSEERRVGKECTG